MAMKTASLYCKHCGTQRLGQAPAPNHILHLLLTIFTMGFWIPVWLIVAIGSGGSYHCTHCGGKM